MAGRTAAIDQVPSGLINVRAKVFGGTIKRATARVDDGPCVEMTNVSRARR
jgi:hypothetical protein